MIKNHLTRSILSSVLATGLALCGAAAFAQNAQQPDNSAQQPPGPPPGPPPMGGRGWHRMDPDTALARMTRRYNLSAEQQSQIKPLLENQMQQMQSLHGDNALSRDDRRAKMLSIHQDTNTKIAAILNDQQKKQFSADQERMRQRMQQRMQGGPPPAGGPPQQ